MRLSNEVGGGTVEGPHTGCWCSGSESECDSERTDHFKSRTKFWNNATFRSQQKGSWNSRRIYLTYYSDKSLAWVFVAYVFASWHYFEHSKGTSMFSRITLALTSWQNYWAISTGNSIWSGWEQCPSDETILKSWVYLGYILDYVTELGDPVTLRSKWPAISWKMIGQ